MLHGVDLVVREGASAAVVGPSGSGKSTLLSAVLGLVRPSAGEVWIGDRCVSRMGRAELAQVRRHSVGMVFQDGELVPELEPVENVAMAALIAGVPAAEAWRRAAGLLDELEVPSGRRSTGVLSGGERQRVAIARALVNRPRLLVADEPTGSLDAERRNAVADLLFSVPARWRTALVVVTHDDEIAARADATATLRDGRLIQEAALP